VRGGYVNSAFRLYRDAVLFPGIVSRLCPAYCGEVCVRAFRDRCVDLKRIERDVADTADRKDSSRYALPEKKERVAVIGAGACGLSCAIKLASKGYAVDLYEQTGETGGRIRSLLPAEVYEADFNAALQYLNIGFRFNERVAHPRDLLELSDAVYVAAGTEGRRFGLDDGYDRASLATGTPGVFAGGGLFETDDVRCIENGIRAAGSIENYLKTGKMGDPTGLRTDSSIDQRYYRLDYEEVAGGDAEAGSARAEALRCFSCDCSVCMDSCQLMRYFRKNPKRIASDLSITVMPVDEKTKRLGSRLLNSCNLCGLCTSVCPAEVDTHEAMLQSRAKLFEAKHLPEAYHDFWLEDMEFSYSDAAYGLVREGDGKADLLFFPGCQLTASSPEVVERVYRFITDLVPNAAMLLSCCGIPAEWAGDAARMDDARARFLDEWRGLGMPEVLFACSSCMKLLRGHAPQVSSRSLYAWLDGHRDAIALPKGLSEERVCVYDPCNSRSDPGAREGVRNLATACGLKLEELEFSGTRAACCGFGGHIYSVNRNLVKEIVQSRTAASEAEYITYCANCRDYFRSVGKESRHILDLLFANGTEARARDGSAEDVCLPDLTERRENRRALKERLLGKAASARRRDATMRVDIPREMREKMDRLLLLEEDVIDTIAFCESENRKLLNNENGHYIGYRKNRVITVWVEYEMTGEAEAVLRNVYTHRMEIKDGERIG
jgi:Fe-S oxidoreductase